VLKLGWTISVPVVELECEEGGALGRGETATRPRKIPAARAGHILVPSPQHVAPPLGKAALTVVEVAEILSLGLSSAGKLIASGRLKVVRVGIGITIDQTEVQALLDREVSAHP